MLTLLTARSLNNMAPLLNQRQNGHSVTKCRQIILSDVIVYYSEHVHGKVTDTSNKWISNLTDTKNIWISKFIHTNNAKFAVNTEGMLSSPSLRQNET